ncbi:VPLPA-CTERM sorting domain-containing protein [Haematobacter missouriensis]|uniref:VPLPA-CTERM sorting domain-containing protein n=2 Tax=Haematobacter missouriensis TaxID=366616 RepID=A0A212AKF1_9RHOB|nr:VPLPA-CTERM sorting domain-containing protein [Haematobacter missouriensis]OWJ81990.1 VPLPA-CTERM sorting domain-containing protein [Haematobacter missouriensis]
MENPMTSRITLAAAALLATALSAPIAGAATYGTLSGKAPIVVAHRGASGYLPEETLGGYELALKMGADYIEPDVQMTADGALIAMHDATLNRTTNVESLFAPRNGGYKVSDFTLAEIKTLTVEPTGALARPDSTYPGFTPGMADPYKVPTLGEVLDLLTTYNKANGTSVGVYPESKTPYNSPQNQAIIATLKEKGYTDTEDKVILQSFVRASVIEMGEALEAQGMQALLAQLGSVRMVDGVYGVAGTDGFFTLAEIAGIADGVGVSYGGITKEFIDAAHDLDLVVHAYTFRPLSEDEAFTMIRPMLDWGLDGFFTDYTDFGRAVVDSLAPVPVPAALPLLAAGLGGLVILRRRKVA